MRSGGNGDFTALAAIGLGVLASLAITRQAPWEPPVRVHETQVVVEPRQNAATTPGVAFHASNLDESGDAILADFGGRVHREAGGVRMVAENVALHAGPTLEEGATLVGVRLALVEATAEGWREVRSGPARSFHLALDGRPLRLATLGLSISHVDESEMVGRWLAVVHVVRMYDGRVVETAVHADEGVLDRLMGWLHDC